MNLRRRVGRWWLAAILPVAVGAGLVAFIEASPPAAAATQTLRGLDVSGHQGNVDWPSVKANGASFAYVKATEGMTFISSSFTQQYNGSANVGLVRGAYHFAHPDSSTGAAQADFFIAHGGGWSADGITLPGALDIEYNPNGATCYGLSASAMVNWISSFVTEYRSRTSRYPTIYSTTDWWTQCTGNSAAFPNDPLWIANYSGSPTPLPHGWSTYTIWQTADHGTFPGDQDTFNGNADNLRSFALGQFTPPPPPTGSGWPTVQQGQSGRQVTTVQYLLNAHGASLTVDGQFGSGTRAAVVSFQSANGLSADGIVGPNTWSALIVTVQQGSTGSAVRAAQAELNAHGASLAVDGQFGSGTRAAVVSFQSAHGLSADGIVGPNTWQALVN